MIEKMNMKEMMHAAIGPYPLILAQFLRSERSGSKTIPETGFQPSPIFFYGPERKEAETGSRLAQNQGVQRFLREASVSLVLLGLLPVFTGCGQPAPPEEAKAALNVVLILTDDQGAHLSALGTPGIRTPNIDALAKNGVLFTNAFAAVPSCSPSRSSINTGMFPHANGHWRNTITPELDEPDISFGREATRVDKVGVHEYVPTLPEVLHDAGYFTAITQKFHMSPPWKFPYSARNPVHNDPAKYREVIGDFIDQAGEKPFYFQANISPPHRPLFKHMEDFPEYRVNPEEIEVPGDMADVPGVRSDFAEYFGCVQLADACAGAIIEELRERGLLENTLIIFTSDQGQPYHRAKASAYYAGLHVPMVVSGPGVKGTDIRDSSLISLLDVMPTVLDYLQEDIPATVQGQSMLPLLIDKGDYQSREYVFGEYNSHGPARSEHYPTRIAFDGRYYYLRNLMPEKNYRLPDDLRNQDKWGNRAYMATVEAAATHPEAYRLLRTLESGRPAEELYDIATDPYQTNNLAGRAEYQQQQGQLSNAVDNWRNLTGDVADDPLEIPTRQTERVAGTPMQ